MVIREGYEPHVGPEHVSPPSAIVGRAARRYRPLVALAHALRGTEQGEFARRARVIREAESLHGAGRHSRLARERRLELFASVRVPR